MITPDKKEFDEKVIQISRVSKKTKGGNQVGFSVLMVVGDKQGRVGVGLGKAPDVLSAIKKGVKKAKKQLITVPLDGTTIPFQMLVNKGAGRVLLKPAPKGTGVIAGGPVRAVVEAAGVRDISAKILGSENQASSVYATFQALKNIQRIVEIRGIKLRSIVDIEREEKEKMKKVQEQAKQKADEADQPEARQGQGKKGQSVKGNPANLKPSANSKPEAKPKPLTKPKPTAKKKSTNKAKSK
jgi:small subunit ribosomal protein S5